MTNDSEGDKQVAFADPASADFVRRFVGPARDVNDFYFDVAYSGKPEQCDTTDGTCETMRREMRFEQPAKADEDNAHRYVLDVDGNGKSETFYRSM